jgi:hypothetical protein
MPIGLVFFFFHLSKAIGLVVGCSIEKLISSFNHKLLTKFDCKKVGLKLITRRLVAPAHIR